MTESSRFDMPWPGDELVYRVTGATDRERFYESGDQSAREVSAVLELAGRPIASFPTILDFGCGCGRILLWLEQLAATSSLHAVDIDDRAIEWIQHNLHFVTAKANHAEPPLDYPDGFFDLVYNHSVFTHIDEKLQDQWLAELRRVTKPRGMVLLTVHGEHAFQHYEEASRGGGGDPSTVRARFRDDGHVFVQEDPWVGSAFPDWYHTAFHAPWYVFDRWSRFFRIRAYVPQGSLGYQDFVLLERLPDDVDPHYGLGPRQGAAPRATAAPLSPSPEEFAAAVDVVVARVRSGPDVGSAAGLGPVSRFYRRLVLRALRHHDEHQRAVDEAMVQAMRALVRSGASPADQADPANGLTLRESNNRLWDALRRTGDRVNRFEADVWQALRDRGGNGSGPSGSTGAPA